MNFDHKDVLERAAKTFVQAFLGVFVMAFANLFDVVNKQGLSGLKSAVVALLGAALAAGISALWNYWLQYRSSAS